MESDGQALFELESMGTNEIGTHEDQGKIEEEHSRSGGMSKTPEG
jgi:hypothetical protein